VLEVFLFASVLKLKFQFLSVAVLVCVKVYVNATTEIVEANITTISRTPRRGLSGSFVAIFALTFSRA
jgi:hypothetical protein